MKKYTNGLITGALLAISAMMFMGAIREPVGRYQISTTYEEYRNNSSVYMLDTATGNLYSRGEGEKKDQWVIMREIPKID